MNDDERPVLKLRRARPAQSGCVFLDKRAGRVPTWYLSYREDNGKQRVVRVGTFAEMPDKEYAKRMAAPILAGILDKHLARKAALDFNFGKKHKNHGCSKHIIQQKVEDQGGRCMICGKEAKLHLDHCHYTSAIRDMLCSPCNMGLGQFQDNPMLLRAAALYLEKHGR